MTSPPSSPLAEEDYEAIEAAVMETSRGRWFLAEYARRNRHSDTLAVLSALERLERMVRRDRSGELHEGLRTDLLGMSKAMGRLRGELSSLRPDGATAGRLGDAGDDLDQVVTATETATQDILAAAERVQEIAWILREHGVDPLQCDGLDQRATEIYLACSFQDLTGQRISRVVATLRDVEARIEHALESSGLDAPLAARRPTPSSDSHLLHGPARSGEGLTQIAVDDVIREKAEPTAPQAPPTAMPLVELEEIILEPVPPPAVMRPPVRIVGATALALAPEPEPLLEPIPTSRIDFADLSFAEKAALFS